MAASPAVAQSPASLQALRWDPSELGNHRYLVQVSKSAKAVHVVIAWRRRDAYLDRVAVVVTAPDGSVVTNVLRGFIKQASGELVFAATRAGVYAIYYQPHLSRGCSNYPTLK